MPFEDKSIRPSLKLYIDLVKLLTYVSYQDIVSFRRGFITDNYEIKMYVNTLFGIIEQLNNSFLSDRSRALSFLTGSSCYSLIYTVFDN